MVPRRFAFQFSRDLLALQPGLELVLVDADHALGQPDARDGAVPDQAPTLREADVESLRDPRHFPERPLCLCDRHIVLWPPLDQVVCLTTYDDTAMMSMTELSDLEGKGM